MALKQSSATAFQDKGGATARRTLLIVQIAMGMVLMVSAALLVKSLQNLQAPGSRISTSAIAGVWSTASLGEWRTTVL